MTTHSMATNRFKSYLFKECWRGGGALLLDDEAAYMAQDTACVYACLLCGRSTTVRNADESNTYITNVSRAA